MKICFVTFEYPPLIVGGAGVYALHITKELAKLGHEVHVISRSINEREVISLENDVYVHRLPIIRKRFFNAPSFWFSLIRRYSEIRKNVGGFDILHSNDVSDFSLLSWRTKEPRIVTIHHLAYLVAQGTPFLKRFLDISSETAFTPFIQRIVISRADKIITVSDFTKRTIISTYSLPISKIAVIPHGIDVNEYMFSRDDVAKYRRSIGLDNYFTFLFVSRLDDPRKNLSLLLRAFKIIRKREKKPVKLVLVGSGDQLRINKILNYYGIEKDVLLLGYVSNHALKKCYSACDVFVSPSKLEGFGLTILEAMAAAKPIIALNRGAISELVRDGVNGILIDKEDPREFANAMTFFLDNHDLTESIGIRNREYVAKNFSWKKSAELTEHVYEALLG